MVKTAEQYFEGVTKTQSKYITKRQGVQAITSCLSDAEQEKRQALTLLLLELLLDSKSSVDYSDKVLRKLKELHLSLPASL